MALQKVPIALNLTQGIDTKTDEKLSMSPSQLINMSHQGKGTPRKRNGITSLSKNIEGGGTITSGKYAFGYEDQALIATDDGIYIYKESSNEWQKISNLRLSTVESKFIASPFSFNTSVENGTLSGIVKTTDYDIYINSETASGVSEAFVVERSSGRLIGNSIFNVDAKLEVIDDVAYAYYIDGTEIKRKNILNGAIVSVTTDLDGKFDVTSDGTFAYIVYRSLAFGSLKVTKQGTGGGGGTTNTFGEPGTILANSYPAIDYNGTNLNVCYHTDDGGAKIKHFQVDTLLVNTVSTAQVTTTDSTNVIAISCVEISGDLFVGYFDTNISKTYIYNYDLSLQTSSLESERFEIALASKLYVYNSEVYFLAKQNDTLSINYLLLSKDMTPHGTIKAFDSTSFSSIYYPLNEIGSGFEVPYIEDKKYVKVAVFDFSFEKAGDFVEFGKSTYIPGSQPSRYNGLVFSESQFIGRPQISSIATAGGAIPAGTYQWIAVYEYEEPNGNIVRSEPSVAFQQNSGGAFQATVTVTSLKISLVPDLFIKIRLYRKEISEEVYKLVDSYELNDRTVSTQTVVDNQSNLDGQPALYTTGDLLANQTMPAVLSYGFSNNRLFAVIEDNQLLFSKKWVIGEGLQFSNFQTVNTEDNQNRRADNLVVCASMDNKLIMFKENTILALFGDGPDGTGTQNAQGNTILGGQIFSEPELITTDVGCISPRSVVATGEGLFFQSRKGIYILTRGLRAEYIGAPAEGFNGLNITGAILLEDINQVRWTTSDGSTIVYDYYYKQWSTFSNFESLACFIHKGKMAILKSDGSFMLENESFNDDGSFITQKLVTGWLKLAGPQEFQRVYRLLMLGEWKSKHYVKVQVYYDYRDYPETEFILDARDTKFERSSGPESSEIYAGENQGEYQFGMHLQRQKCEAIKVSVEDVQSGNTIGESFSLTDFTFIAGRKKGLNKLREGVQY